MNEIVLFDFDLCLLEDYPHITPPIYANNSPSNPFMTKFGTLIYFVSMFGFIYSSHRNSSYENELYRLSVTLITTNKVPIYYKGKLA